MELRGTPQRRFVRCSLVLAALMLLNASSAFGQWIKMGGNDTVDAYMDLNLLERKGDYVLSWRLYDYRAAQKTSSNQTYRSAATLVATKCADRTEAMLSFKQYAEAMGKGSVVAAREIPREEWQVNRITTGSIGEALNKVACERFKMWKPFAVQR